MDHVICYMCLLEGNVREFESFLYRAAVYKKGSNTIRALQLSSAASVCPEDKYVTGQLRIILYAVRYPSGCCSFQFCSLV